MLVGVVSDTHDNVPAVERAVEIFEGEGEGVDAVIHCGDVIAPPVVGLFEGLEVHAVLGNNDGDVDAIEQQFMDLDGGHLHGGLEQ